MGANYKTGYKSSQKKKKKKGMMQTFSTKMKWSVLCASQAWRPSPARNKEHIKV